MEEQWKRIIIDGEIFDYEVSSLGNVRNIDTGRLLKKNKNPKGYLQLRINKKTISVHRLVAKAFISNPDNLPQINHINGIKTDNRIENLEWCDNSNNQLHAYKLGLNKPLLGENNPYNKYDEDNIKNACDLLNSGKYSCNEVSKMLNINYHTIHCLVKKKCWKHITNKYRFDNIKHGKKFHYYQNSIDRAIISGLNKKDIITTLIRHGIDEKEAKNLYKRRKKKIKEGKSLVQNTVYIDEGIEIF